MSSKDPYTLDNESSIPAPFNTLIPSYFRNWDNPHTKVEDILKRHAPTCYVKFGGANIVGHDGIRAMRAGFVDPVNGPCVDLEHNLKTCWMPARVSTTESMSSSESESNASQTEQAFIIKSSIWYRLVNGQEIEAECTSYIKFVNTDHQKEGDEDSWLITEYEVCMSSFEVMDAVKALSAGGGG